MNELFLQALEAAMRPETLLAILLAGLYGLLVGAIPGLTATMAVALMVPITFFLDDLTAIAAIISLEAFAIFAGDIPSTLVRIPGTPASAAYTDDAYALTRRGLHQRALGISLWFSVTGGIFGLLILVVAAPALAQLAFAFTSAEYFWLYVIGLSCAAIVSQGTRLQGLIGLLIGLALTTVGLSEAHSVPRFTFLHDDLIGGINFIPAMIGLFGVSEVLRNAFALEEPQPIPQEVGADGRRESFLSQALGGVIMLWLRRFWHWLWASNVGVIIGIIPGAGADIAAWVSYAISKRLSKTPEEYGNGSVEGLADAGAANNSALAGAWIPALVLGIPGDSVTAIVIGVLLMKNITPGPNIFARPEQLVLVYGIYIAFVLANLLLLPLGLLAIRGGSLLIRIPRRILMPAILVFCLIGSYAINSSTLDVAIMLAMGVLGFLLERRGIPIGPLVLGLVLGGSLEQSFVQTWSKENSLLGFFNRPLAAGLATAVTIMWTLPPLIRWMRRRNMVNPASEGERTA